MRSELIYLKFQNDSRFNIYLQFADRALYDSQTDLLFKLGFTSVDYKSVKRASTAKDSCTIIAINKASAKLTSALDGLYQDEVLSQSGAAFQYYKKGCASALISLSKVNWQVALVEDCSFEGLKFFYNRIISAALTKYGVLSFWGVKAQSTLIVTKPVVSQSECFFIDIDANKVYSEGEVTDFDSSLNIGRLDSFQKQEQRSMSKEMMYSFLATHTCVFSSLSSVYIMRTNLLKVTKILSAFSYPEKNFEPRANS
ncbi:MAG: hypothetical protein N4A33_07425 [Bacteriovoracaceae bacterium]|jgi:hypothetical protein|nr:hypothetical protein [Bacteriovoracaceae bacterium]